MYRFMSPVLFRDVSPRCVSCAKCADSHTPDVGGRFGSLRLDYGNSVLVGLPAYLLRQLQSVLNAAARLVYHLKARDLITDALISLHLRAPERILYKTAVLTYIALRGGAPRYLSSLVHVADVHGWRTLSLCRIEPSANSVVQTVNRRRSSVSGRSSTVLEQASWQCHVGQFVVGFSAAAETHPVPAVIPGIILWYS